MSVEVDTYLNALPPDQRAALTDLRATLRALLPDHSEVMSYAMPGFRAPQGPTKAKPKMVVGYAAFAKHLGLYPHSGSIIPHLDCRPFQTSKSGVLFTPQNPLPLPLIKAIIAARQAEISPTSRLS